MLKLVRNFENVTKLLCLSNKNQQLRSLKNTVIDKNILKFLFKGVCYLRKDDFIQRFLSLLLLILMSKNARQATTRQSTTLIQSKVTPLNNKPLFTRALLQYKWLKPQLELLQLHHFCLILKNFKSKNIKDMYIQYLQSVSKNPPLLKKYYKMKDIPKDIKKVVANRLKKHSIRPQVFCKLLRRIQEKYKIVAREEYINNLCLKINPKIQQSNKKNISKDQQSKNKKLSVRVVDYKSPLHFKTKRSSQQSSRGKLQNTKLGQLVKDNYKNSEDYGLKVYKFKHIRNKLSAHNLHQKDSCEKSPQKFIKDNDYRQVNYYFNSLKPGHKKANSNHTPQKSINTSRKTLSKNKISLKSQKLKTELSKQKQKRLKYNSKIYYN